MPKTISSLRALAFLTSCCVVASVDVSASALTPSGLPVDDAESVDDTEVPESAETPIDAPSVGPISPPEPSTPVIDVSLQAVEEAPPSPPAKPTPTAKISSRGQINLEGRAFFYPDDSDYLDDFGLAVSGRVQFNWRLKPWRIKAGVFGRAAALETGRSIVLPEDAFIAFRSKWVRLRLGTQVLNWSATEAFHPADVLNSRNLDSDVERPEKIGEPMFSVNLRLWPGARLEAYYMPLRMQPRLPSTRSRLSFTPDEITVAPFIEDASVRIGRALWVDRNGDISRTVLSHQWGARWSQTIEGADISLQVLQHNDRTQPSFVVSNSGLPEPSADNTLTLQPLYNFVTHAGLTYTHVIEDWVLKVESAYRYFHSVRPESGDLFERLPYTTTDHVQVAIGLEYGWVYDNDHEATLLLEGQGFIWPDGRPAGVSQDFQGPFENDVLIGYRHAFNDIDSREIFLSVITDVMTWPEVLVSASYSQRIGEVWGLRVGARLCFTGQAEGFPTGLQALRNDHQLSLTLTRYF